MFKALAGSFALAALAALLPQSQTMAEPVESTGVTAPEIPALILPASPQIKAAFPGSSITLTHPVNLLQPIPPAASKLPSPLN